MKRSRFAEEQIIGIAKAETGLRVTDCAVRMVSMGSLKPGARSGYVVVWSSNCARP